MENPKNPLEIQAQLNRLHEVVVELLSSKGDSTSQRLLFFIKRTLRQFNIDHQFHEKEIVIEAYERTRKRVETGEVIENLPGWLKAVSYNIIREYNRKVNQSRTLPVQLSHNTSYSLPETSSEFIDSQRIEALLAALSQIKSEDEDLLILRLVKGFSWQQISEYLEEKDKETGKRHPAQNLRKRGERALARLKQKYFSIDQAYPSRGREVNYGNHEAD